MIALFDTMHFLCAKILGNKRRHGIPDRDKNQRKNIFHSHRCRVPRKGLCAEGIDHRLYNHHPDGNRGLLKDGGNSNSKHGRQLFSIKTLKTALIALYSIKE